ncbi:hypothetical protein DL96DRAFT_1822510 [Flagelloscypha sp. PMI_526]|nr:hypothetical protein DL96DRAFT_1822510 [Flagelloscypha sp. PMI_526]
MTMASSSSKLGGLSDSAVDTFKGIIDGARAGHKGSFDHLQRFLGEYLQSQETGSLLMSLGLLEVLFGHIRSTLIPSKVFDPGCTDSVNAYPAWARATMALGCLARLRTSETFESEEWQPSRRDIQRIHRAWPDIFAWSKFIFLIVQRPIQVAGGRESLLLLGDIWDNLRIVDPNFNQAIMAIPRALSLITRY